MTPVLIETSGLSLSTPNGRPLIRSLTMSLGYDRVALIGRNGAGKSSLARVLAGLSDAYQGRLDRRCRVRLLPQELHADRLDMSPGELRRRRLEKIVEAGHELLILDEPSQDLDEESVAWLESQLAVWPRGLILISHDPRLLRHFEHFFLIAESGCRLFSGTFDALEEMLERERHEGQRKYLRKLNVLAGREQHNDRINRRRRRKKNLGRLHEERRSPTREQLHGNKGYAETSQGKAAKIRKARISAVRDWVKASRRALAVELPLEVVMPSLPEDDGQPIIELEGVRLEADRTLVEGLDLVIGPRDRIGIVGPNGAGKSTLLRTMLGERSPDGGSVRTARARVGFIGQGATEWETEESLLMRLAATSDASLDEIAQVILAHRFPLSLAERSLASLSPGERVRAAFICLMQQSPVPEVLLLDEPTYSLDLLGTRALTDALAAWPGGLVVATHEPHLLERVGVSDVLRMG